MTRWIPIAVVAALALAAGGSARPAVSADLQPLGGGEVRGTVTFTDADGGTAVALTVHGLAPRAIARPRLHAGTQLADLSASAAHLPTLHADAGGTARAAGRVLFRGQEPIRLTDIADGAHLVVVAVEARIVAYARVPRLARRATRTQLVVSHGGRIYVDGAQVARGSQPTWSPSGEQIAFTRDGQIFMIDRDGTNERRLTRREPGLHWPGSFPAWSPDGRRIAFSGTRDLFTVTVADRKLRPLTRSPHSWLANVTPAYSPDGRTIAFSRNTDAFNSDIFVMSAEGRNLRRLTTSRGAHSRLGEEGMPTWSPDGRTIVFVSNRDGNFELYAIDRRGRNERRITYTPDSDEENPRFSRNGKRLLYTHEGRVATVATDGTGVRELALGTAADWR